ncbi:hypothetical protein ABTX99_27990 [Streptomyces flaveolus]|uniref:hypothetical protein n=1 Tax=Streptomyces flaveolus TaxID=67297 RepID=UPI003332E33A
MPHHALEIQLTRPARPVELRAVARSIPLAANSDTTRLMALSPGKTARRAARHLRRHLGTSLPIDVITTHYPDPGGQVLLSVALPPATQATLRQSAQQSEQTPEQTVERALRQELAQCDRDEADRLGREVTSLLATTTPTRLLAALGHVLARTHGVVPR